MHKLILAAAILVPTVAQAGYFDQPRIMSPDEMRQRNMERQLDDIQDSMDRQEQRERRREQNCRTGYEQACR